jgi:hypothetical protein
MVNPRVGISHIGAKTDPSTYCVTSGCDTYRFIRHNHPEGFATQLYFFKTLLPTGSIRAGSPGERGHSLIYSYGSSKLSMRSLTRTS